MKGMGRLATGAALAVALSLAMLIALLLFLLLSLFCSLIRGRRQQQHSLPQRRNDNDSAENQSEQPPRPLTFPFYAHGVIKAPTKYLLSIPNLEAAAAKPPPSPPPSSHSTGTGQFVYISNPIYDRLQSPSGTGPVDEEVIDYNEIANGISPPLKLMKKLPPVLPKACLFDVPSSSSASNSPCSSPSR